MSISFSRFFPVSLCVPCPFSFLLFFLSCLFLSRFFTFFSFPVLQLCCFFPVFPFFSIPLCVFPYPLFSCSFPLSFSFIVPSFCVICYLSCVLSVPSVLVLFLSFLFLFLPLPTLKFMFFLFHSFSFSFSFSFPHSNSANQKQRSSPSVKNRSWQKIWLDGQQSQMAFYLYQPNMEN